MRGQMLLIVVLVMVVVLTVALSAATRTITNLRVSSDEESSERAFSAAEAGLERALGGNQSTTGTFDNASTYTTTVIQETGRELLLNNNVTVLKDDSEDVWLATYPTFATPYTGNLTIHWGSANDVCSPNEAENTMAALDIAVISGNIANPTITHYPVDPCPQRRIANNFSPVSLGAGTVKDKSFPYRTTIAVNSGLLARVRPLYAPTTIGVNGCNSGGANCIDLPSQGTIIESLGVSENAQRKIVTFRSYPRIPSELFPFVLFAPN